MSICQDKKYVDRVYRTSLLIKNRNKFPERVLKKLIPFIILILFLLSCRGESPVSLNENRKISRIVSLSPSITAQILDLESAHLLAGVTTFSPPLPHKVEIVGNLTNPNIEKIILLKPDAVLYSVEDAAVQRTEQLTAMGIKLFSFRRNADYKTICDNYRYLARILGKEELADKKLAAYNKRLEEIKIKAAENRVKPSAAFFVSQEPLITVSRLSFISGIINDAGGINVYHYLEKAYPMVSAESLIILKPDIILSMMPDGEKFFSRLLSGYNMEEKNLSGKVYPINPDNAALYTPGNYVSSAEEISGKISLYLNKNGSK